MESKQERAVEEEVMEPLSPTAQYYSSSFINLTILAVLEFEIPIDDSSTMSLVNNVFLPINPRFSSLMVRDEHGERQWKKVNFKPEHHIYYPIFPDGLSPESYDVHLQDYLTKLSMDELPLNRPLWEIHIIKYPTSNAACTVVFNLHHALGDGFSLMGALFSCLQRADDPSLPLTFPSLRPTTHQLSNNEKNIFKIVPRILSMFLHTTTDFISTLMKSSDDQTPIRSGYSGVEFQPTTISTVTFSLDRIKQIKAKIGGTVNEIMIATIFYGCRLYMQAESKGSSNARSTAMVALNTRQFSSYLTIQEMAKGTGTESPWGNKFAFFHVSIPQSPDAEAADPLEFVSKARHIIKGKKNSLGVFLTGVFLDMIRKLKGSEATAGFIYRSLRNTSMAISNMIGPVEQVALAGHPCKSMYYMVQSLPQSLFITMLSYMGNLRVAVGAKKGFINHKLFTSCLDTAFERISKAALN